MRCLLASCLILGLLLAQSTTASVLDIKWSTFFNASDVEAYTSNGKDLIFIGKSTNVKALNASTGEVVWSVNRPQGDNELLATLQAVGPNKDILLAHFTGGVPQYGAFDGKTGAVLYNNITDPELASPSGFQVFTDDSVIFGKETLNGQVVVTFFSYNLKTGARNYKKVVPMGAVTNGIITSTGLLVAQGLPPGVDFGFTAGFTFDAKTAEFICNFTSGEAQQVSAGNIVGGVSGYDIILFDGSKTAGDGSTDCKIVKNLHQSQGPTEPVPSATDFYLKSYSASEQMTDKVIKVGDQGQTLWTVDIPIGVKAKFAFRDFFAATNLGFQPDVTVMNGAGVFTAVNKTDGTVKWQTNKDTPLPSGPPSAFAGEQIYPLGNKHHFVGTLQGWYVYNQGTQQVVETNQFQPIIGTASFMDNNGAFVVFADLKTDMLTAVQMKKSKN